MASGFERLERFFSSSRRKDKGTQENTSVSRTVRSTHVSYPGPCAPSSPEPEYPPPSFLKPTSMVMEPRREVQNYSIRNKRTVANQHTREKGRSQSLPDVKKSLRSQSSAFKPLEVERRTQIYSSKCSPPIDEQPRTPATPGSGFPEDILFRSFEIPSESTDASQRCCMIDGESPNTPKQEAQQRNLLDWSPKHISLLFNPEDLPSLNEQLGLNPRDDMKEPRILMPSPMPAPPQMPPPKSPLRRKPVGSPPSPHNRLSSEYQHWGFSKFPRQLSVISSTTCGTYSPPMSDSEDEYATLLSHHRQTASRYDSLSSLSADSSPQSILKARRSAIHAGHGLTPTREASGSRLDDPRHSRTNSRGSPAPRSRLQNTNGAAALSASNVKTKQEHILQEPTINDIYTLSDEDIFEARPFTPAPQLPPPVPPKDDISVRVRHGAQTDKLQPQRVCVGISQGGELTPPETPVDSNFLIPMPTSHSIEAAGAIMAAQIAQRYNFDLIYLVSLWPSGSGNHLDPSLPYTDQSPQRSPTFGGELHAGPGARVTGRYLAAFGLDQIQIGKPFPIEQKLLLKALRSEDWNEYGDDNAPFSHGWTRSFNTDLVLHGFQEVTKSAKNRGIVFAAYTKQHNDALIPEEPTMKKEVLQRLYLDVARLIDALTRQN